MSPTILLGLLLAAGSAVATNVANAQKHRRANAVPGTGRGGLCRFFASLGRVRLGALSSPGHVGS